MCAETCSLSLGQALVCLLTYQDGGYLIFNNTFMGVD